MNRLSITAARTVSLRALRRPRFAIGAVGLVYGLAVAAWGSLLSVHALYPSYVSSFVSPEVVDLSAPVALTELSMPQGSETMTAIDRLLPEVPQADLALDLPAPALPDAPAPDAQIVEVAAIAGPDLPGVRPVLRPGTEIVDEATETVVLAVPTETGLASSPRPQIAPEALRVAAAASLAAREVTLAAAPQAAPEVAAPVAVTPVKADPVIRPAPILSGKGCGTALAKAMPRRKSGAATGSAFFASVGQASGGARDNLIINELARGNMPDFLRKLQPVAFRGTDANGAAAEIVICVTPDYLALGSDADFVRVPLGLPAASTIAAQFGMVLPTSRMVDAIYAQANIKLSPAPMQAGPQMESTDYFLRHNATIEAQRQGRFGLISGHKKDIVMASRMASNPGRVAIYGWHRSLNNPIQPVSTVHGASYADYSHGIRLVSRTAYLNGKAVDLADLLASPRYAGLINSDGPLPGRVIQLASR